MRMKTGRPAASLERRIVRTAVRAARVSAAILLEGFRQRLSVREKPGAGLVTQIDTRSERAALRILAREFPDFGVLAEESSAREPSGPVSARWILDPLDGTTNYVHRFPVFCVSLAVEWEGELLAGVILNPVLRDLYLAVRGKGAWLNGRRLRVSRKERLADCLLTTGFASRRDPRRSDLCAFERFTALSHGVRRPGSAALDLAYVARGVFDGFWERRLSPWDWAAGALLVEEAGGKMTDFGGNRLTLQSRELLASNGRVHNQMRRTLAEVCSTPV
jgi:myo-inositol-1(or 4)-monophosphatase